MFKNIDNSTDLVMDKLKGWYEGLILHLPNFVIAVLIIIFFWLLAKGVRSIMYRLLSRVLTNKSALDLALTISSFFLIVLGMVIALQVLGWSTAVTSVLASIGVIGLALGLAFQDAASNLISGVSMAIHSPINVGDIIETNSYTGTVTKIGLRSTIIYDPKGQDIVMPNRMIHQNPYRHYTINGIRRIDLECGISYGEKLPNVEKIVTEAIKKIEYLKRDRPIEFFYTEFGDSSINFVVRYWINFRRIPDFMKAQSDGIMNIKASFDQEGITIPFPIRTLDFGIKGGKTLAEIYPPSLGQSE